MAGESQQEQAVESQEDAARRRRRALQDVLNNRKMTLQDAALAAGTTPSSIGNFLNGRTNSLNVATYEPLAAYLGMTINDLVGVPVIGMPEPLICDAKSRWDSPPDRDLAGCEIEIQGEIATGQMVSNPVWSKDKWIKMAIPLETLSLQGSRFLRLSSEEMGILFKPGTVLEVVDLKDYKGQVKDGNKVIVYRTTPEGAVEVSCREIQVEGGVCRIIPRSNRRQFRHESMQIAWPISGRKIKTPSGDVVEIKAVVVRAICDLV